MKTHCQILILLGLCTLSTTAQEDTLNLKEITVSSPLWQKAGVGQNRVVLETGDLHSYNNASLASEISIGTPVNITGTGYGLLANPVIRGTHANATQVFWNGMPVNSPTLGTSDLNLYRSSAFNQISILPGGSGAELGGGTMGGAILLSRNLEFEHKHEISLSGSTASYGEAAGNLAYSFANEKTAVTLGASHFQSQNDFPIQTIYGDELILDNSAVYSTGAFTSYGHHWGTSSLETHLLWQAHTRQIPDSRSTINPSRPSEALQEDQQFRLQNIWQNQRWRVEQGFGYEWQTYSDARFFVDDHHSFWQSSSEVEYQLLQTDKLVWLGGTYFNYYEAAGTQLNQHQVDYGLRTSAVIRLHPRLLLKPALAESFLDYRAVAFLPSLAAEYFLEKKLVLKAKTGRVFSIPTLNQRYWPRVGEVDILPESGWNSELSAQFETQEHWVVLATYYNRLENKIVWLPDPLGARPQNFNRVKTLGAELLGRHNFGSQEALQYFMQYSFNYSYPVVTSDRAEVLNGQEGEKLLIYVPPFTADTRIGIRWQQFQTSVSAEYNSGAYSTADNDQYLRLDDFVLLHFQLEWTWQHSRWNLQPGVEMHNIMNNDYELFFNRPMPGRVFRFYLTLNHQL